MSKAWLIGGAAFVAILLAGSIVVALVQQEQPLPEGTPERTVQLFLTSLRGGDLKQAYRYFSEELKEQCDLENFAGSAPWSERLLEDTRVAYQDTQDLGGTAVVTARVSRISGGGLFGTSESSHAERFNLVREVGEWRLSQQPWPHFGCNKLEPRPVSPGVGAAPPAEETPERTVTRHVKAAENDDLKLIYSLWSQRLRAECPFDSLSAAAPPRGIGIADARLVVKEVKYGENTAIVNAQISIRSSAREDLTAPSARRFSLAWQEQKWVFAEYPWPFSDCGAPNSTPEATSTLRSGPGSRSA